MVAGNQESKNGPPLAHHEFTVSPYGHECPWTTTYMLHIFACMAENRKPQDPAVRQANIQTDRPWATDTGTQNHSSNDNGNSLPLPVSACQDAARLALAPLPHHPLRALRLPGRRRHARPTHIAQAHAVLALRVHVPNPTLHCPVQSCETLYNAT